MLNWPATAHQEEAPMADVVNALEDMTYDKCMECPWLMQLARAQYNNGSKHGLCAMEWLMRYGVIGSH